MDYSLRAGLTGQTLRRSYAAQFEVREVGAGGNRVELTGYASVTDRPYEMSDLLGDYSEVVRSGAFGATLSRSPDVAFLTNHGGLTMARTSSGTLRLEEDTRGLLSVAQLNMERGDVRDLVTAVRDGDIDQMSFAFRVDDQAWNDRYTEREIRAVDLDRGDVSAVNFGANPSTAISARGVSVRALQMRFACR